MTTIFAFVYVEHFISDTSKFRRYADDSDSDDDEGVRKRRRQKSESEVRAQVHSESTNTEAEVEVHRLEEEMPVEVPRDNIAADTTKHTVNRSNGKREEYSELDTDVDMANESLADISDIVLEEYPVVDTHVEMRKPQESLKPSTEISKSEKNPICRTLVDASLKSEGNVTDLVSSSNIKENTPTKDSLLQDDSVSNSYSNSYYSRFNRRRNSSESEESDVELESLPASRRSSVSGSASLSGSRPESRCSLNSEPSLAASDIQEPMDDLVQMGSKVNSGIKDVNNVATSKTGGGKSDVDVVSSKLDDSAKFLGNKTDLKTKPPQTSHKGSSDVKRTHGKQKSTANDLDPVLSSSSTSESSSSASSDSDNDSDSSTSSSSNHSYDHRPATVSSSGAKANADDKKSAIVNKSKTSQEEKVAAKEKISKNEHYKRDKDVQDEREPNKSRNIQEKMKELAHYKASTAAKSHEASDRGHQTKSRRERSWSRENRRPNRRGNEVIADPEFDAANYRDNNYSGKQPNVSKDDVRRRECLKKHIESASSEVRHFKDIEKLKKDKFFETDALERKRAKSKDSRSDKDQNNKVSHKSDSFKTSRSEKVPFNLKKTSVSSNSKENKTSKTDKDHGTKSLKRNEKQKQVVKERRKSDSANKQLSESSSSSDSESEASVSSLSESSSDSESETWRNKKRGVTRNANDLELEKRRRRLQEREDKRKAQKQDELTRGRQREQDRRDDSLKNRMEQKDRRYDDRRSYDSRDRKDKRTEERVTSRNVDSHSKSQVSYRHDRGASSTKTRDYVVDSNPARKHFEEVDSDSETEAQRTSVISVIKSDKHKSNSSEIPKLLDIKVSKPRTKEKRRSFDTKEKLIIQVAKSETDEDSKQSFSKKNKKKNKKEKKKKKSILSGDSSEDESRAISPPRLEQQVINVTFKHAGMG